MRMTFVISICTLIVMSGCSTTYQAGTSSTEQEELIKFSQMPLSTSESKLDHEYKLSGWYPWTVTPAKNKTTYTLKRYQGKTVIHADADTSASGLMAPLKPKPVVGKELIWEWKALGHIEAADNAQGHTDDAPLRLILAFDGDKKSLSLKDQMAFELAHLISGQEMPYATLMYIWASQKHNNKILGNKYTSRLKMIVVEEGDEHVGEWRKYQRDIEQDYRAAFQESPGRLTAIGIMTDTDNTKSLVKAIYGDIAIKRK